MKNVKAQPDPDPKALGLILDALSQALPSLEGLVEACHNLWSEAGKTIQGKGDRGQSHIPGQISCETPILVNFTNGKSRLISVEDMERIKPEDYSLFLNAASGMIGINLPSQEPQIQTVREAGIDSVQDILGAMIEYPRINFGNVSVGALLPHRQSMTPDAFRKAMAKIRYAVQKGDEKGPFLRHFDRSHFSVSDSGHAWRISMQKGNICFIRFLHPSERFRLMRRP